MLLIDLLNQSRIRRSQIGHSGRQLQENLGQTAVLSGGQRFGELARRKREKCHFKSAGNGERKRIGFLYLLCIV